MHQWKEETRLKEASTCEEQREDIQQDLWENHGAGDREANSRIFRQDSENEGLDMVEGLAPSKTRQHTE
jgi:hypothetical protein